MSILPSFFVPLIDGNVSDEKIKELFEISYQLGKIKLIDRVLKEDKLGNVYNSIYIFFDSFNFDEITIKFLEQSKVKSNPARVYYNVEKTLYWKVLLNTAERNNINPSSKNQIEQFILSPFVTIRKKKTKAIEKKKFRSFTAPKLHPAPCLSFVTERQKKTKIDPIILQEFNQRFHKNLQPSRLLQELEQKARDFDSGKPFY